MEGSDKKYGELTKMRKQNLPVYDTACLLSIRRDDALGQRDKGSPSVNEVERKQTLIRNAG